MRRTKQWWARLTRGERIFLVNAERNEKHFGYSGMLPEGYGDCVMCSTPCSVGFCDSCLSEVIRIIKKADGKGGTA